jgi:hypothetical protein
MDYLAVAPNVRAKLTTEDLFSMLLKFVTSFDSMCELKAAEMEKERKKAARKAGVAPGSASPGRKFDTSALLGGPGKAKFKMPTR